MQGTRLPDAVMGEPGPGWEAWEGRPSAECPSGAYMKVTSRRQDGVEFVRWYIVDPDGKIGSLGPRHAVTEHDDGTISVTPSILANDSRAASEQMGGAAPGAIAGPGWHGYLEHGVWRSC